MLTQNKVDEQPGATQPDLVAEQLEENLESGEGVKEINKHVTQDFPMREVAFKLPGVGWEMRFNPCVSFLGMLVLWLFAGLCMGFPEDAGAQLGTARANITEFFTWFIVGTQPLYLVFLCIIAYQFGDQKLAADQDEKPEFSNMSFFAMIFSAGVAVGLFFYGVSEPLWHMDSHFYAKQGFRTEDEKAIFALTYTVHHWGLPAWACYTMVGVTIGILSYREGLPMTIRSSLYPLLGHHTWGWIGDLIDAGSIVVVVGGVCTSLGLGAIQMSQGLIRLGWVSQDLTEAQQNNLYIAVIWVVTAIATLSVVSGLNYGIKFLSQAAFLMGTVLWFLVLVLDNPWFLLNLIVQETGFYIQYGLVQLQFWTDAFGQLTHGEGRNTDGQGAEQWFQNAWTVFYLTWWCSWATFVGMFIARISRGRTVREVICYTMFIPLAYIILWFSVFGGAGLRSQRRANELEVLGEECFRNKTYYHVDMVNSWDVGCFNPPIDPVTKESCTYANLTYTNPAPWQGPVCKFNPSGAVSDAWFNVLYQYGRVGAFLAGLSVFTLGIYFVTSSDSGSLVVDHMASNGREEHHWLQRVFWAVTEGAVATGLLMAGGSQALSALQAFSVIAGLPFNIIICFMVTSLWRTLEDFELKRKGMYRPWREFTMPLYGGVLNVGEYIFRLGPLADKLGFEQVERPGHELPTQEMVKEFFFALFLPFVSMYRITSKFGSADQKQRMIHSVVMSGSTFVLFILWIAFFASTAAPDMYISNPIYAFAWCAMGTFMCVIATVRYQMRERLNIRGNILEDFFASIFYPQVFTQMILELENATTNATEKAREV